MEVLILGPNSGIGRAIAHELARTGRQLILAGRDTRQIHTMAADLHIRYGIQAAIRSFDALDFASHQAFFEACLDGKERLAGIILCFGAMSDQTDAERDFSLAKQMIDVNYSAYVSILNLAASYFKRRRSGFICAISSVAGDRGRKSNFIYGSSKAALSTYLQGLRNDLSSSGVNVITVKPGFVDTKMTWGLIKPNSPLVASPRKVAVDILRAIENRRDVQYTPRFWWWIMMVIKLIPERIFKRMSL